MVSLAKVVFQRGRLSRSHRCFCKRLPQFVLHSVHLPCDPARRCCCTPTCAQAGILSGPSPALAGCSLAKCSLGTPPAGLTLRLSRDAEAQDTALPRRLCPSLAPHGCWVFTVAAGPLWGGRDLPWDGHRQFQTLPATPRAIRGVQSLRHWCGCQNERKNEHHPSEGERCGGQEGRGKEVLAAPRSDRTEQISLSACRVSRTGQGTAWGWRSSWRKRLVWSRASPPASALGAGGVGKGEEKVEP